MKNFSEATLGWIIVLIIQAIFIVAAWVAHGAGVTAPNWLVFLPILVALFGVIAVAIIVAFTETAIERASDVRLLSELVKRSPSRVRAPGEKIALGGQHDEILVGVGYDNTARILMDVDTLERLDELLAEERDS